MALPRLLGLEVTISQEPTQCLWPWGNQTSSYQMLPEVSRSRQGREERHQLRVMPCNLGRQDSTKCTCDSNKSLGVMHLRWGTIVVREYRVGR